MEGSNGIVKHIAHIALHISWKLLSVRLTVKKSITLHSDPEGRKDIVLQCAKRYKEACKPDRDGDRWKPKLAPDGDNVRLGSQVLQPIPSQEHKLAAKVMVALKTFFTEGVKTIFTLDIVNANSEPLQADTSAYMLPYKFRSQFWTAKGTTVDGQFVLATPLTCRALLYVLQKAPQHLTRCWDGMFCVSSMYT